jgi:hypothetical protein
MRNQERGASRRASLDTRWASFRSLLIRWVSALRCAGAAVRLRVDSAVCIYVYYLTGCLSSPPFFWAARGDGIREGRTSP